MRTSQKSWGGGLSRRAKLVVALVVVLLLALPIFAIANSDAIQSVFADFQQSFSNNQIVAEHEPMSLEEGIEALSISGLTVVEVSAGDLHSLAILNDGTLWAWGSGANGRLGLNSTANALVPTQVGTATNWDSISVGYGHSLATRTDGTLWSWGANWMGQLGLNSTANALVPTQVGTATNWESISAGMYHSLAIQSDGTLWSWGVNWMGQLGLNSTANALVPTQVGTATNWDSISAGGLHSLAIQNNGTLWAWGDGSDGQHGLGHGDEVLVPTQVGALTTWESVSGGNVYSLAIKTDGTLWTWGNNDIGVLGLGDTNSRHVPTQVGALTTWESVSAGWGHALAIQSDGTLWSWGAGHTSALGLGDISNRHVPTQVGALTTWESVSGGNVHSLATKTDGTLWVSGREVSGLLGLNGQLGGDSILHTYIFTLVNPSVTANAPVNSSTVAMTTNMLSITFERPLDPGATYNFPAGTGGSITIDQGASVDMSAGTWNAERTVFTVPLTLTTAGALHTVTVTDFGFPNIPHTFTFTTPRTPGDVDSDFTKTLTMPEGTTPRNVDFDFSFTPRQVDITEGSTTITSRPTGQVPTITNQTINLLAADATTTGGTTTIIGSLDLANLLDTLTFSGGGLFVWEVAEVAGSSNTNTSPAGPNFMTYDNARFFLVAYIYSCGTFGALNIHAATAPVAPATAFTVGAKLDAINFNNQYRVDREDTALDIRKAVTGRFANLDTLFSFTLSLQGHTLAPLPTPTGTTPPFSVSIVDASNNTVVRTIGFSYNSTTLEQILTFQLRDGERLVIPTLPAGTTFRVVETGTAGFTPQVQVFSGGTEVNLSALEGANLDTGSHLLREEGDNSARYTNAYRDITPTGLTISNAPYIAIAALVILAVLIATTRKRKSIEELPVV